MASYHEIHDIRNDPDVVKKVHVAVADVAVDILSESPTIQARQDWAITAIKDPGSVAPEITHYVLIANKGATPTQIKNAADAAYKTNVANAVNEIVGEAS